MHISISKARAAIEAFLSESSSVEKPPQAWQVLWRNHIVFHCGDTTQRIEFQVLKECSKFAKPNFLYVFIICHMCLVFFKPISCFVFFFVEISQASAYNFQSGKIIDLWYPKPKNLQMESLSRYHIIHRPIFDGLRLDDLDSKFKKERQGFPGFFWRIP